MNMSKYSLAVVVAGLVAAPAFANEISLYNTGVDSSGNVLSEGTVDPFYTLTSVPSGSSSTVVGFTSAGGYPIGPWYGDDALSTWIGPNNDAQADGPVGYYDYQTTFNLTGFNLNTVSIGGQVAVDDVLVNILLNGVPLGYTAPWNTWTQFTIDQANAAGDFVAGINTLDFIVDNYQGPTGLRVEFNSVDPQPVPDSGLGIGISGLVFLLLLAASRRMQMRRLVA
jgi:hypothetical protein